MRSVILQSHVGLDGMLQLKVPPDFTNTDLTVILMFQQVFKPSLEKSSSKNVDESSILVDKGGILVARVEPLSDMTDIVQEERKRRDEKLLENIGL
jgi:hypothetical protein